MSRLEECDKQNTFYVGEALSLTRAALHRSEYRQISSNVSQQSQSDSKLLQEKGVLGGLSIEDKSPSNILAGIKPISDCVVAIDHFVRGQNETLKDTASKLVFGTHPLNLDTAVKHR